MASRIEWWSIRLVLFGLIGLSAVFVYGQVTDRVHMALRKDIIIKLCQNYGLSAVDYDYPHSPKCHDEKTGIMYLPKDLLQKRGGHL